MKNLTYNEIRSVIEEGIAIGWFLLATQLQPGIWRGLCLIQGTFAVGAGLYYAYKHSKEE